MTERSSTIDFRPRAAMLAVAMTGLLFSGCSLINDRSDDYATAEQSRALNSKPVMATASMAARGRKSIVLERSVIQITPAACRASSTSPWNFSLRGVRGSRIPVSICPMR